MAMHLVSCALGKDGGPAAGDFEGVRTNPQESQNALCEVGHTGDQFLKFFAFM
jgi:hypothetical protein